ncbi:hypothetical protein BX666DRAFT_1995673 [Dichotomocladium elegans]|nr:hypothetical protein BX666DRAFT_1995673 [Dichotomocladium elegans]
MAKKHSNANRQKRQKKAAAKKNATIAAATASVNAPTKEETVIAEQQRDVATEEKQLTDNASETTPIQEEIKEKEASASDEEPPVSVAESKGDREVMKNEQLADVDGAEDKKNETKETPTVEHGVCMSQQVVNIVPVPLKESTADQEQVPTVSAAAVEGEAVLEKTEHLTATIEQVNPTSSEKPVAADLSSTKPAAPVLNVEKAEAPLSTNKTIEFPSPSMVAEENKDATSSQEHVTDSTKEETVSPSHKVQEMAANDAVKLEPDNSTHLSASVAVEIKEPLINGSTSIAAKEVAVDSTKESSVIEGTANETKARTDEKKPTVATKTTVTEKKTSTPVTKTATTREIKAFEEKPKKKILGLFAKKGKDQKVCKAAIFLGSQLIIRHIN